METGAREEGAAEQGATVRCLREGRLRTSHKNIPVIDPHYLEIKSAVSISVLQAAPGCSGVISFLPFSALMTGIQSELLRRQTPPQVREVRTTGR